MKNLKRALMFVFLFSFINIIAIAQNEKTASIYYPQNLTQLNSYTPSSNYGTEVAFLRADSSFYFYGRVSNKWYKLNAPYSTLFPSLTIGGTATTNVQSALTKLIEQDFSFYNNADTIYSLKGRDTLNTNYKQALEYGKLYPNSTVASQVAANTKTISKALRTGGTVVLPQNKLYYVNEIPFRVSNTTLDGNGSTLRLAPNQSSISESVLDVNKVANLNQMDNIVIKNIIIDGNRSNQNKTGELEGIDVRNTTNFRMYNVTVMNCVSDGVDVDANNQGNAGLIVSNCKFMGNGGMALHLYDVDNSVIEGNIFTSNIEDETTTPSVVQAAIDINPNSANVNNKSMGVVIIGNTFNDNPTAFYNLGGKVLFANNEVTACNSTVTASGYGVLSGDTLTHVMYNTFDGSSNDMINGRVGVIAGNQIRNAGKDGIDLNSQFAKTYNLVSNNNITNSNQSGIRVGVGPLNLINNNIYKSGTTGIEIIASGGGHIVRGGVIDASVSHGINSVVRMNIYDMLVKNSGGTGIRLTSVNAKNSEIRNTTSISNTGLGINAGSDSITISNVLSRNNKSWGIALTNGVRLLSSIVEGNTTFGAIAGSAVQGGIISGCFFNGNSGDNLRIDAASKIQITNTSVGGYIWNRAGEFRGVTAVTANYTLTNLDQYITADASSGSLNITIGSLFTNHNTLAKTGRTIFINRIDNTANNVTILGAINGGTNLVLNKNESAILQVVSTSSVRATIIKDPNETAKNIYTENGTLTSNREANLATFDLSFRSTAKTNILTMDASSGRIGINASPSESFGQLHVKSDNSGADGAVISGANTTNQQILRLRNDGGLRLNNYISTNVAQMTAANLGVTPTKNTLGISTDGTLYKVNNDTITRQFTYLHANESLIGTLGTAPNNTPDTTARAIHVLGDLVGSKLESIEVATHRNLGAAGVSLAAIVYRPSNNTYTSTGNFSIANGNTTKISNINITLQKGDFIYIREVSVAAGAANWRGLGAEIRFVKP